MKTFIAAITLSVLALSLRAADTYKTDEEGFIRDWLVLAPFAIAETSGADEIDKQQVPDEAKLQPKEGDKAKSGGKDIAWKKVKIKEYFFDFNAILGTVDNLTENSAGYAVCYIVADDEVKGVELCMGSNDQGKVYLNGKEAVKFAETRTVEKDQDTAKNLTLVKGCNALVFKVINEQNNWQGCIRFKDKDGKPMTGLKIKLAP